MKILYVTQYYWPEPFNTTDMCESLVASGHEVTVLTGLPNIGMPGNDIPDEYRDKTKWTQERNGVKIIRTWMKPRKSGLLHRGLNYFSFWISGNRKAKSLPDDFDIVIGYEVSPVMSVDPGIAYAKKNDKKMLLYCLDLWPENLKAGGVKEGSLLFKIMRRVSARIYGDADKIAVTSPLFSEYFRNDLNLPNLNIVYLPQYAEDLFSSDTTTESPFSYVEEKLNFTFAGNVGKAQSVETIVKAAALLKNDERFLFHIVGGGSSLEDVRWLAESESLTNIVFHGQHPLEAMPAFYAASDAMIVSFTDDPVIGYTLPRKVQSYMAAGKPILASVSGEARRVVEAAECGLCSDAEDASGFADICKEFADTDRSDEFSANSRRYYLDNFSKDRFFEKLERILRSMTEDEDDEDGV